MDSTQDRVKKVHAALERHPMVNLHRFPVELRVEDDVLVLEGEVEDIAAKRVVRLVGVNEFGIDGVRDELRVVSGEPRGDGTIAADVERVLKEEPAFRDYLMTASDGPPEPPARTTELRQRGVISATVADGVVTLHGAVESLSHKRLAEVLAWWTRGVGNVANHMQVLPEERDTDEEVTDALRMVLEKDPALDAGSIAVEVRDHRVTLKGSVGGDEQWRLAARDAWYLTGVQDVENLLEIRPGMGS